MLECKQGASRFYKIMSLMSKTTAAYVAGLIDGEGSISITRVKKSECTRGITHSCRIRITMSWKAKDLIYWLKNSFGGYISFRDRGQEKNSQDAYEWCISREKQVLPFILKVSPYLKLKKPQAELLRAFLKTFTPFNESSYIQNVKGKCRYTELKEEVFQLREKMFLQMKELNKKGRIVQLERLNRTTRKGCDSPNL